MNDFQVSLLVAIVVVGVAVRTEGLLATSLEAKITFFKLMILACEVSLLPDISDHLIDWPASDVTLWFSGFLTLRALLISQQTDTKLAEDSTAVGAHPDFIKD